jgi:hypothetical protein
MAWVTDSPNLLDAELAQDKPKDFQKVRDLRDRDSYLFDSAMRCGTFATPHRFVYASGRIDFSVSLSSSTGTVQKVIDYSADIPEGDPNLLSTGITPRVSFGYEEDTSGGALNWTTNLIQATATVKDSTNLYTGMTVDIIVYSGVAATGTVTGFLMFHVIGDPVSGE